MKQAHQVVKNILLTEKGTRLTETDNQYFFKVDPSANKVEIKTAVEALFGVNVESVRTMNHPGKKKRSRSMQYGRTAAWKKAVVTVQEGQSIDLA